MSRSIKPTWSLYFDLRLILGVLDLGERGSLPKSLPTILERRDLVRRKIPS